MIGQIGPNGRDGSSLRDTGSKAMVNSNIKPLVNRLALPSLPSLPIMLPFHTTTTHLKILQK